MMCLKMIIRPLQQNLGRRITTLTAGSGTKEFGDWHDVSRASCLSYRRLASVRLQGGFSHPTTTTHTAKASVATHAGRWTLDAEHQTRLPVRKTKDTFTSAPSVILAVQVQSFCSFPVEPVKRDRDCRDLRIHLASGLSFETEQKERRGNSSSGTNNINSSRRTNMYHAATSSITSDDGHDAGGVARYGSIESGIVSTGLPNAYDPLQHSDKCSHDGASTAPSTQEESTLRVWALRLSLYANVVITLAKLTAFLLTGSLSVLAAFVDSVLDIVSQLVLNYTEEHSSHQRSSALYPAGASRLEPIGVLTCAALMGMASFAVIKQALQTLITRQGILQHETEFVVVFSLSSMILIVVVKLGLWRLCSKAADERGFANNHDGAYKQAIQMRDPTMEALAQDHWNDCLSNGVAVIALACAIQDLRLWFLDPVGAIVISVYIIYSWYMTGKEQIEHLTGKAAPKEFLDELFELANNFDERIMLVDTIRAYHFGPKFLVEVEVVLPKETYLFESHDLGMELQYEIEAREEVERCFVHMDYESRPYDEHVVSKVPELREKYRPRRMNSSSGAHSV